MVGIQEKQVRNSSEFNGYHRRQGPVSGVASQAANVLGDAFELAELQAQLAKADARNATKAALRPIGWLVIGICAALASLPVLTLGVATMLDALTVLTAWQAQLLVGGLAAVIALALIYFSIKKMGSVAGEFQRSADELAKNVAWAKVVLRSGPPS